MAAWNPRANEIYVKALGLNSPEAVRSYLDDACAGDAELRAAVESLMNAGQRAGAFLESPAGGIDTAAAPELQPVAEQIWVFAGKGPTRVSAFFQQCAVCELKIYKAVAELIQSRQLVWSHAAPVTKVA